jgi:hypothetical protein
MNPLPDYLMDMVRREPPNPEMIVPASTPVVSFGDFRTASVATLGINPSNREFENNNALLRGQNRRLATLESLNARSLSSLTDDQVLQVVQECNRYFSGPYYHWFDTLDKVIKSGLEASYFDGSACHLDLVQWATSKKWSDLSPTEKQLFLLDGQSHLRNQIENSNLSVILVNGQSVWSAIELAGLGIPREIDRKYFGKKKTSCKIYELQNGKQIFIGWSANLQSQHGANSPELLTQLSDSISAIKRR